MLSVLKNFASEDGIKFRKVMSKDSNQKNCDPLLTVTGDPSISGCGHLGFTCVFVCVPHTSTFQA